MARSGFAGVRALTEMVEGVLPFVGACWSWEPLEQEESCGCWWWGPEKLLEAASFVLWLCVLGWEGMGWQQRCAPAPWGWQDLVVS